MGINCFLCKREFTKENPLIIVKQDNKNRVICKKHPHPKDIIIKE